MRISKITRIEFIVLVLLFLSFFFIFTLNDERKAATTRYVGPSYAWNDFDDINWGIVQDGDTFVVEDADYAPSSTIYIQKNDITFQTSGYPTISDSNFASSAPLIVCDSTSYGCDNVTFSGFIFHISDMVNNGNSDIVFLHGTSVARLSGATFQNCIFAVDESDAVTGDYTDDILLENCIFEKIVDNGNLVNLSNCNDFSVSKCSFLPTSGSGIHFDSMLAFDNCENSVITNCMFENYELYESMDYAIAMHSNNLDTVIVNNIAYGNFNECVIYDNANYSGLICVHNTLVNNAEINNGARGYHAIRNTTNRISLFKNNIIKTKSNSYDCYPMFIDGPNYWTPLTAANCDYNCYHPTGSSNMYVGCWGGSSYTIAQWYSNTSLDGNSTNENPNLVDYWRMNDQSAPVTPTSVMKSGTYMASYVYDIDGGARLNGSVSIGADQYSEAVFNPTCTAGLHFGTQSSNTNMNITITNYGLSDFTISDIDLTNGVQDAFYISAGGSAPYVLTAGATHTITVTFNAGAVSINTGYHQAVLSVEHNAFMNHGTVDTDDMPIDGTKQ